MTDAMKASFPNPINLDGLTRFISDSINLNKLSSRMADFGFPAGMDANRDKFAKAPAIQFSYFVTSAETDINVDVRHIYQPLLSGEETPDDIKGSRYAGGSAAVFSMRRIESNCYDSIRYEWKIQNRGKRERHGRKLVLVNQNEIRPEILQAVIPIPDVRPDQTTKTAADINAGGFEGKFDYKLEMRDADGENRFPNYRREFNIQICVRLRWAIDE